MTRAFVETIGFIAGICTTLSFIPQIVKILKTSKTRDISFVMYAVLTMGIFLWMVYGILLGELPLIIANGISFMFCLAILTMKLVYGRR